MVLSIPVVSYAIDAVAFLVLFLLFLTRWQGRTHGTVLTISSLLTALWAAMVAFQVASDTPFFLLSEILEVLKNVSWSIFLILLVGYYPLQDSYSSTRLKPYAIAILATYLLHLIWTVNLFGIQRIVSESTAFDIAVAGRIALAVIGMLLVEQLYRNTPVKSRWGIKFACLGIGGLFAYDFYLYSDAMLFRHINEEVWAARGVVNTLTVPLVALSAVRNPQWALEISVSRRILFHTAALFGAAVYLLVMAAAGYYLRYVGGSWGGVFQVVFLFGAIFLLLGILFSGVFRSWLKVFISKNFYNYNYDYREEWLRFTKLLAKDEHGLGERTIHALAELVESTGGALFLGRDAGSYETVAQWNMTPARHSELKTSSLCQFMETKQWVVDLQEYEAFPEKYGELSIPLWLRSTPKAWLVVPLILHGKLLGFVVLSQPRSKIVLDWEIIDLLKIAGSQAASFLAQQESANALMTARQFESFNRMSTFVVHDLKNLVSQLSLMLANALKHRNNPEFQKDMLDTVELSIRKMRRLLEKLSSGASTEKPSMILIEDILHQVVEDKSSVEPIPKLEIRNHGLEVMADRAKLERVIGHLIQNAVEATPKNGTVVVSLSARNGEVAIDIVDTGCGMTAEFIKERLFRPFESTKSAGMGIGVFEAHEYVSEIGGHLDVESSISTGTKFSVILPTRMPNQVKEMMQ